ncbi:hypothetical protein BGZ60DRAFT_432626 [Tricladium varicosporioides]|nr:hypothetical protein BGZ60DRAFT_432626 [Hymenoscyphus varicosporioides]
MISQYAPPSIQPRQKPLKTASNPDSTTPITPRNFPVVHRKNSIFFNSSFMDTTRSLISSKSLSSKHLTFRICGFKTLKDFSVQLEYELLGTESVSVRQDPLVTTQTGPRNLLFPAVLHALWRVQIWRRAEFCFGGQLNYQVFIPSSEIIETCFRATGSLRDTAIGASG